MHITEVTDGIDIDHIVPYFQPVMDLDSNAVWNYECLARLVTENEQTFLPSEFLQLVQKQKCHGKLTKVIFHRSAEYFRNINVAWSINVSKEDIVEASLAKFLTEYLTYYPNPHRVSIELMASVAIDFPEEFKAFVLICKALDIRLFIDHFGASPGNVDKILSLPVDGVKIDGSLINHMAKDSEVSNFVSLLNQKAEKQNIVTIAEHIEDANTLALIDEMGIKYAQGFFFSQPQSCLSNKQPH